MKAAIVVDIEIHNLKEYKEYIELITPSVLERNGRYLVRGGSPETLDGDWQSSRIVIIEFPSKDIAIAWLNAPELKHIHDMRRNNASKCNMLVCEMAEDA